MAWRVEVDVLYFYVYDEDYVRKLVKEVSEGNLVALSESKYFEDEIGKIRLRYDFAYSIFRRYLENRDLLFGTATITYGTLLKVEKELFSCEEMQSLKEDKYFRIVSDFFKGCKECLVTKDKDCYIYIKYID